MAKIETIRDLVYAQIEKPKAIAVSPKKLTIAKNKGVANEYLDQKLPNRVIKTPVSLRKKIEKQNSFVNPDSQFKTPTLLKNLGKDPQATVEVAQAHTTMSKAQVQAKVMKDQAKTGITKPQELVQKSRQVRQFSRVPRTISNLIT